MAVMECCTHDCAFSLYPPGHVPYGRAAVAPVAPDASPLLLPAEEEGAQQGAMWALATWEQTRFGAALDAATGKLWPRDGPSSHRAIQRTRVDELAALLGLDADLPAPTGEAFARALDIPRLMLLDATTQYQQAGAFDAGAQVLVGLLNHPALRSRCVLERVLTCGALAGLWGPAHGWEVARGGPQRRVFPGWGLPSG